MKSRVSLNPNEHLYYKDVLTKYLDPGPISAIFETNLQGNLFMN